MTTSTEVVNLGGPFLAGSSLTYTGQFIDSNGNPVVPSALTMTLCDTSSRAVYNGVLDVNILNTGRGTVDDEGNLTLNLLTTDTGKFTPYPRESRSILLNWTYDSSLTGKREVQFTLQDSSPG